MILDVYNDAFEYAAQDGKALLKLGVINVLGMIFLPYFLSDRIFLQCYQIGVGGMINGG